MLDPLNLSKSQEMTKPRRVQAAKRVELALVTFTDESNQQHSTLAVIGDKNVHLLEGRDLGFSKNSTPSGRAAQWLAQAIFDKLEEGKPQKEAPIDIEKPHKEKGK
jgi:hypothetical protein